MLMSILKHEITGKHTEKRKKATTSRTFNTESKSKREPVFYI